MKYKITSALKHVMSTITSYIHNCDVDILRFTLYNINRTVQYIIWLEQQHTKNLQ